ncbi:MAG: hypothetical protein ACE5EA_11320, partial [Nitrospirota bacterium]
IRSLFRVSGKVREYRENQKGVGELALLIKYSYIIIVVGYTVTKKSTEKPLYLKLLALQLLGFRSIGRLLNVS